MRYRRKNSRRKSDPVSEIEVKLSKRTFSADSLFKKMENTKGKIIAFIPVGIPDIGTLENDDFFKDGIEQISSDFNETYFPVDNVEKILIKITVHSFSESEQIGLKIHPAFRGCFLRFEADNLTYLDISIFKKRIFDFLIILNISIPGCYRFGEGFIKLFDNRSNEIIDQESTPIWMSQIHFAVQYSMKVKWPGISKLNIKDTFEWYFMQIQSIDGVSNSPLSRALNALSHLFHSSLHGLWAEDIFWALLGVEALYLENKTGIQNEINRKTELFLGKRNSFKKVFSEMYNYRSRFIHGDIDFSGNELLADGDKAFSQYFNKMQDAKDLAIAILIATLQKMAQKNYSNLNFDYVLLNK